MIASAAIESAVSHRVTPGAYARHCERGVNQDVGPPAVGVPGCGRERSNAEIAAASSAID